MSIEFKINCGHGEQEAVITNDGELVMADYDPSDDETAEIFGEKMSGCYYLQDVWEDVVVKHFQEEDRWDDFLHLVRVGEDYWDGYRMQHRWGNVYDVSEPFIDRLKDAVEEQDEVAVDIAHAINAFVFDSISDYPEVDAEEVGKHDEDPGGTVTYIEERTLKINDQPIASWKRGNIRESSDIYSFTSDVTDMDEFGGDYNAGSESKVLPAVLKALDLEDEDVDEPEDFYEKPEADPTGEGLFGVMYEVIPWDKREEGTVEEVDVVVYEGDSDAENAYELAQDIMKWRGMDDEYILTKVRRLAPSEVERQKAEGVDETIDPLYHEWVELEDWADRPEDFEG